MKSSTTNSASPTAPTACPFCRSTEITAPNDKISVSTYWRCEKCGQMWNVARHLEFQRAPRWNRNY